MINALLILNSINVHLFGDVLLPLKSFYHVLSVSTFPFLFLFTADLVYHKKKIIGCTP